MFKSSFSMRYSPSLIVGVPINRGSEVIDIGNFGGVDKLKWVDICETSLNWGISNRLGGHSYVDNCKD